ncbi:MAG: FHA domain-containing protein [Planctomycetota bacterium]|nr:MAG: FHA domain-containing protein [Planctomycetota bacterium]
MLSLNCNRSRQQWPVPWPPRRLAAARSDASAMRRLSSRPASHHKNPRKSQVDWMASFHVIRGRDKGQHFAVRGSNATIGRDASNQIQLHDTEVSRRHARIVRVGPDAYEIIDNNSSNGTFVNGRRIERHPLRTGDRIQVGRTLMIFTGGPTPLSTEQLHDALSVQEDASDSALELSQIRSKMEPRAGLSQFDRGDITAALEHVGRGDDNLLEVVYQVSQAIHRTLDLNDLLRQVLELIFDWIQCDRGYILMMDDVTGRLRPIYGRERRSNRADPAESSQPSGSTQRPIRISRTILDHVVQSREGVLTSNAQDDTRWQNAESVANLGIHEAICVPMLGRYGLVGAIYVDTTMSAGVYAERRGKSRLEPAHLKLLMAIAGQAALAIEDTQFYHAMMQAERLAVMGQTIANLSHHVKNILQGISGGNYLVEEGLHQGNLDLIRKGWGIVQRNQERISNLVMDMLSFSKERTPHLVPHDVREILRDVAEMVGGRAKEAGIAWSMVVPDAPVIADVDSEAMHRAILNVVLNAMDACQSMLTSAEPSTADPAGATGSINAADAAAQRRIDVRLEADTESVTIVVEDTGPGIAADEIPRIFTPFESSKGSKGTGLGLPVTQKTLREHGGDVVVESELGRGTRFLLRWPRHASSADADEAGPPTETL